MSTKKKARVSQETLVGERLYLRPFRKDDLSHVIRWSKDPEIRKLTGEESPMNRKQAEEWYRRMRREEDRVWFTIVLKEGDRVIGESGLLRIFKPWRCTDMTIIIGEKDAWGAGYGTEAGRLVLDHAFKKLRLHRVSIGVVGFNERAIRFWEGLGFRSEGAQRDGYYCDGRYSDFIMMSILREEWRRLSAPTSPCHEGTRAP